MPELKKDVPDLRYIVLVSLNELLTVPSVHYPYDQPYAHGVKDLVLISHTSGSTGQLRFRRLVFCCCCQLSQIRCFKVDLIST